MKKFTIEDLREGKVSAKYTGNLELLKKLLKEAFPKDRNIPSGGCAYYKRFIPERWGAYYHTGNLPSQPVEDFFAEPYPKVMYVSDLSKEQALKDRTQRVVFMKKCGKYLAWADATNIKEAEREFYVMSWEYAVDIPKESTIKVTIDDIAEWKGVDPSLVKIVKNTSK